MIRTVFSLGAMVAIVAMVAVGTTAFFGDQEAATGNTFATGDIDLKIDNESYYNGALNDGTSWGLSDLNEECVTNAGTGPCLFFNFPDLKPDDEGEDTISLHIETNDAWACMDVTVRDFDDNGCTEPEAADGDESCGGDEGELQNELNFVWWKDDGDNVLEDDEANELLYGPDSLASLELNVPLADSSGNAIFGDEPLAGETTYYIGKAWCYGELTLTPETQDGDGKTGSNGPLDRGTGISCDGTGLDNTTQTDSATGDITFRAIQSRNNETFDCRGECELNREETIIANSQFEVPEVDTPQNWDIFSPAGAWNVEWRDAGPVVHEGEPRPETAYLELHRGVVGTPDQGEQYAELDTDWDGPDGGLTGEPASVRIYQDVDTDVGKNYEISFVWAPRPNTPASDNELEVQWGDDVYTLGPLADNDAGIEWIEETILVTATEETTRLSFTDLGEANSQGTFIDDIKLFSEVCVLPGEAVNGD